MASATVSGRSKSSDKGIVRKGLESLVETGKHALHAANPLTDIKNVAQATYNIVSEKPSWGKYKENLKKGKFLGEGNLATVMFNSGAVLSGMYPALLGLRAAVGAGSYVGREIVTKDKVMDGLAGIVEKTSTVPATLGAAVGVPYKDTKRALSKRNVKKSINKLKDDDYYKEKVFPVSLDAAIGVRGYGSLVGAKWGAGALSKAAEGVGKKTKNKYAKWTTEKAAKGLGFAKNIASDAISTLLFKQGLANAPNSGVVKAANGEYNEAVQEKIDYVKSGEAKDDAINYARTELKDDVVKLAKRGAEQVAETAKETYDYVADGELKKDVREAWKYCSSGEAVGDVVKDFLYGVGDAVGITPSEQYAVLVSGYNDYGNHFIVAEQMKAYKSLVDMGFPKENIVVLTPNGYCPYYSLDHIEGAKEFKAALEDKSYNHHASEENFEKVLKDMGKKVDGNDAFVLYVTAHGNTDWFNGNSYFGLDNGNDMVYDKELKRMVKPIDAGLELYMIESCHSGGFGKNLAKESGDNEVFVGASRSSEPAWSDRGGNALGRYFMDELKSRGGINNDLEPKEVIDCLADAATKFRNNHFMAGIYGQRPVVGTDGDSRVVAA